MRRGDIQTQEPVRTTKSNILYSAPSFGLGIFKEEAATDCMGRPVILKHLALKRPGSEKCHTEEAITVVI